MWTLSTQFSKVNPERPELGLENGAVMVDTLCEALAWWKCRTSTQCSVRRTQTLTDPSGRVVRVNFS